MFAATTAAQGCRARTAARLSRSPCCCLRYRPATDNFLFPALGPGIYAVLDPRSGVETDLPQPKPDDEYTYRAPDQQDWC